MQHVACDAPAVSITAEAAGDSMLRPKELELLSPEEEAEAMQRFDARFAEMRRVETGRADMEPARGEGRVSAEPIRL